MKVQYVSVSGRHITSIIIVYNTGLIWSVQVVETGDLNFFLALVQFGFTRFPLLSLTFSFSLYIFFLVSVFTIHGFVHLNYSVYLITI